jgi:hypothetical protein
MKEKVFLFLNDLSQGKYAYFCLIVVFLGLFVLFVIGLMLSIFKTEFSLKKRLALMIFSLPLCALLPISFNKNRGFVLILALIFSYFILSPLFFIRVKKHEVIEEKNLIKLIDKAVKDTGDMERVNKPSKTPLDSIEKVQKAHEEERVSVKNTPDFSHVKNIIERLNAFPLTTMDKKQIKDLENAIILIENGQQEDYGINDELGALLKMMAKYGV